MAAKEVINKLFNDDDSALQRYLKTGSFGTISVSTGSVLMIVAAVLATGILLMYYYKFFIKNK